jgi:surface polysaccharide O-acyltransferase-like enzyme
LKKNINYLQNIHYFRAIAIVFIVFSHCFDLKFSNLNLNKTFLAEAIKNLLPGATTFFVFISGYLFSHIYYKNFHYNTFMLVKLKNVLLPFLFISSITPFFYLIRIFYASIENSNNLSNYIDKLKNYSFFETYLLGHSGITGLWYVPFIMTVFGLSSIYLRFFLFNYRQQLFIILFLLLISIFLHRSSLPELKTIFQNLLYFTPVYLLGIVSSQRQEFFYSKFKNKEFHLLFLILVVLILQIIFGTVEKLENIYEISFVNIDLMIIQKLLFCIFFVFFLQRFNAKKINILSLLAENSFGIFFIHSIYIFIVRTSIEKSGISFTTTSILFFFFGATFILLLSLVTSILVRKAFPNKSRYFIGC